MLTGSEVSSGKKKDLRREETISKKKTKKEGASGLTFPFS